jgi:hypothetical protein
VEVVTEHAALDHREVAEAALLSGVFADPSAPTHLQILLVLLEGERNVSDPVRSLDRHGAGCPCIAMLALVWLC